MDVSHVKKKLLSGELKLKSVNAKSAVWSTFGVVTDSNDKESAFVACKKCNHVLAYNKNCGTSTMRRHKCAVISSDKQQPILNVNPIKLPPSSTTAPKKIKDAIISGCVDFCCKDLRPFDTVAGSGFKDLIRVVSKSNVLF